MAPPRARFPASYALRPALLGSLSLALPGAGAGAHALRAALLGSLSLALPSAAKLRASDVDDLVQVAFSPEACGLINIGRAPQCLHWWGVEEPWQVGSTDCLGSPLQHWLLPQDGQGVLRPAAYPDLCLQAHRREELGFHYPASTGPSLHSQTLALRVAKCSGHPNQSFVFSQPGQVGHICLAGDHSMCLGENYKCMPDTFLSREVILAPEEVLRACGHCTLYGTMEVVFPFSRNSLLGSKRFDLAMYNSIIWVLLALQVFYFAGVCLRAKQELMRTSLSGVPSARELASQLRSCLRSAWCGGDAVPDRLRAIVDRLRAQRVLAIFNVVVHFLALYLLAKTYHFYMLHAEGVGKVSFAFLKEAVTDSELPECTFMFICMFPFWMRPHWVGARTISGSYVIVILFHSLLIVRRADNIAAVDCGLNHRISSVLLRTVTSIVFAQPSLSAFLNIIVSTLEVAINSWSVDFNPPDSLVFTRELLITSLIVCMAWGQESSLRAQSAALLEAKEANCSRIAVSSLLQGFCDAVVYLDQDIQITDAGKLNGLLLLPSNKSWQDVPFTNLVHSDDVPRVTRHLEKSREALNCTAPPIGYPISIALQDMNRVSVKIDLHCTCVQGADDQICYVLGLKEAMETVPPVPTESCPFPSVLGVSESQFAEGNRRQSVEDESLESRAADSSSETDAALGHGDTFRMVAFKPDSFEILDVTTGFEHLAGLAARREYFLDYLDRPGEFAEMMRDLADGVASGRLPSGKTFRSERPLVLKFPGWERKAEAMVEIAFRFPGSQAEEGEGGGLVAVARLLGVRPLRERRDRGSSSSSSSRRSPGSRRRRREREEGDASNASPRGLETSEARRSDVQSQTGQEGRTERSHSWWQHGQGLEEGPPPSGGAAAPELPAAPSAAAAALGALGHRVSL